MLSQFARLAARGHPARLAGPALRFRAVLSAPPCRALSGLREAKDVASDEVIARQAAIRPIMELAKERGLDPDRLEAYGRFKAKVPLDYLDSMGASDGNLILV